MSILIEHVNDSLQTAIVSCVVLRSPYLTLQYVTEDQAPDQALFDTQGT